MTGLALALLLLAVAATLMVRPWRLLQGGRFATPLLAAATLLPFAWAWPALVLQPLPLHWSAAPLLVLVLGWPLAIPLFVLAGASTMLTAHATLSQALVLTVWSGVVPATGTLLLGHAVRKLAGPHPVAYILGRAFLVPLAVLAAGGLATVFFGHGPRLGDAQLVATVLLAMGEASWTCAVASLLVAYRPQWLATWSDDLYLGKTVPARVPVGGRRR